MESAKIITTDQRLRVLRAIDKLDRLGLGGVIQLLGESRRDQSGDVTEGAGLDDIQIGIVRGILDATHDKADQENIIASMDFALSSPTGQQGRAELEKIHELVHSAGYEADRIAIDTTIVRGLEYYTGPVFEAQLTFEVPNEKGEPVVFGSVGGGGRYDGLVGRFRGDEVPATGFSVGVSRLASALKAIGKLDDEGARGPVVVTVMDKDRLADYQKIVAELRNAGIAAEMYLGGSGMKAQLKYADRRDAPAAIIAGSQEFDAGKLQIKDLAAGKEQAAAIASHADYKEERPGQFEVKRDEIVTAVKQLLDRQRPG